MTIIIPRLIVGSFEESFDVAILEKNNITHILNVASELHVSERVGRCYAKFGIQDDDPSEDIQKTLPNALKFIHSAFQNDGSVFVHCLEGKSRSVCVCIAYLVIFLGMNFDESIKLVSDKRNIDIYPRYLEQTRCFCDKTVKN